MTDRKVAVVTGASSGVGRASVRAFAAAGYDVGLIARGRDGLAAASAEVAACGRRAAWVAADVASAPAVSDAASTLEDALGPIDVWVNDAMATVFGPFLSLTAEEFERVTAVTYLGYVNGTRAALERMSVRDRGVVVQVGSALAYRGIPLQAAYCGAKHAIKGFTDAVRAELLHDGSGIRVVEVHLPAMNTPQFTEQRSKLAWPAGAQPVPPIFQPEVAARAIVAAAAGASSRGRRSRRAVHVGLPTVATVIGGFLVPSFVDGLLGRSGYDRQRASGTTSSALPGRGLADRDGFDEPLGGGRGAHGRFDSVAKERSRFTELSLSRPVDAMVSVGGRAAAALGAAVAGGRRADPSKSPPGAGTRACASIGSSASTTPTAPSWES